MNLVQIKAADYMWAISMEHEAAINEVMLLTKSDYSTVEGLLSNIMARGASRYEAQLVAIDHLNNGRNWQILL